MVQRMWGTECIFRIFQCNDWSTFFKTNLTLNLRALLLWIYREYHFYLIRGLFFVNSVTWAFYFYLFMTTEWVCARFFLKFFIEQVIVLVRRHLWLIGLHFGWWNRLFRANSGVRIAKIAHFLVLRKKDKFRTYFGTNFNVRWDFFEQAKIFVTVVLRDLKFVIIAMKLF